MRSDVRAAEEPREVELQAPGERPRSAPGRGRGDRRVHPAQARALRPGGHSPCCGGGGSAPGGPGHPAAARRPAPGLPRPARPRSPAPGPEPPPARGHVTRDLPGTRGAARHGVVGGGCPGALPLRGHGGSGRPAHFRSGRTRGGEEGRAEVGEPWVPRSAGWAGPGVAPRGPRAAGLAGPAPLLLSGCSLPRSRTGARSTAGLAAFGRRPGSRVGGRLQRSSSESAWPGSSMKRERGSACRREGPSPGNLRRGNFILTHRIIFMLWFFTGNLRPLSPELVTLWGPVHGGWTRLL